MVDRIGTITSYNRTIADIQQGQSTLADIQRQISSGSKTDNFPDLGSQTTFVLNVKSIISANASTISRNASISARIQQSDQALSNLNVIARDLQALLVAENSISGEAQNLSLAVDSLRERFIDVVNTNFNGRYLFGGSRTNVAPVDETSAQNNITIAGGPGNFTYTYDDDYYQGDSVSLSINVNRTESISYGIPGNDPAIRDLLGALNLSEIAESANSQDHLEAAITQVDTVVDALANLRTNLGLNLEALESANTLIERENVELKIVLEDATGVDVAAASVEVALTEATLTASLQTFARISALSLSDFIR